MRSRRDGLLEDRCEGQNTTVVEREEGPGERERERSDNQFALSS